MAKIHNFMGWDKPGLAVITGAASGMGSEFATQLTQQGFNLMLVDRQQESLEQVASELISKYQVTVETNVTDLANMEQINQLADHLRATDEINVLINNAGFGLVGSFAELDVNAHLNMQMVHNTTPIILTRAILPKMIEQNRGVITFTASTAAMNRSPYSSLYTPTKAFLVGFAECLALELLKTNVRVQALCPGFTHTAFHANRELHELKSSIPKGMWQTPDQVVKASLAV